MTLFPVFPRKQWRRLVSRDGPKQTVPVAGMSGFTEVFSSVSCKSGRIPYDPMTMPQVANASERLFAFFLVPRHMPDVDSRR